MLFLWYWPVYFLYIDWLIFYWLTAQPADELPPMNYASQDTLYTWQQPSASPLSEESVRQTLHPDRPPTHSSSHCQCASGSGLDQCYLQPSPVSSDAYPHYAYCTVQAAPIPVQGGYQYSPVQGMVPVQGAASCLSTSFVSDRSLVGHPTRDGSLWGYYKLWEFVEPAMSDGVCGVCFERRESFGPRYKWWEPMGPTLSEGSLLGLL